MAQIRFPFEVSLADIDANPGIFIDAVFSTLQSSFLLLPRGPGFVEYQRFQQGYEVLKRHTSNFAQLDPDRLLNALAEDALALIVLRTMLGFTPPELAYVASRETGVTISQSYARTLDRRVREQSDALQNLSPLQRKRVSAMLAIMTDLLNAGAASVPSEMIHRLDQVDTRSGSSSIRHVAAEGVPYAMLLYERFLGRPFAGHRDAVSELVGAVMEDAVETQLREAGVSYRKTRRAERIEGFDQVPDFIVPDEWNPQIVIEAKITEDDGTARDKITRIQHLAEISRRHRAQGRSGFQVVACIDGRGFGMRRSDMQKLLTATAGKVFTLSTLPSLLEMTDLQRFRTVLPRTQTES